MRTIEISLKEILVFVLYKWLPILLCAVIIAALMGGYSFMGIPRGAQLAKVKTDNALAIEKAEAAIASYEEEIVTKQAEIDKYYAANNIENRKVATIKAEISFEPENVKISTIRSRYTALFRDLSLKDMLAGSITAEYEEDVLRRLIRVSIKSSAESPNTVTISATGGDDFDLPAIVESIFNYFAGEIEDTIGRTGPHTFYLVRSTLTDAIEGETLFDDEIQKLQKQINSLRSDIRDKKESIRKIENQLKTATSLKAVLVSAVTGAAAGVVVGIVFAILVYLIKVPVVTPEQIQKRLGIRYIGGAHSKKRYGFSVLADKIAGSYLTFATKAEASNYIGTSLSEVMERGSLLITGSLAEKELENFAKALQDTGALSDGITLIIAPDVTSSADSLKELTQADSVVLVERLGKSILKRVSWQSERIAFSEKKLLGYVLY